MTDERTAVISSVTSKDGTTNSSRKPIERARDEEPGREHLLDARRVMQAPGGPGEDDSGGFAFGGWSVSYWDDRMGQIMGKAMSTPFDLVLGRKTYDVFAAYWAHAPEEAGAKPLNDATKYVASRGRPTLEWEKSVLIEGDAGPVQLTSRLAVEKYHAIGRPTDPEQPGCLRHRDRSEGS
jgi:hypothetical protein